MSVPEPCLPRDSEEVLTETLIYETTDESVERVFF